MSQWIIDIAIVLACFYGAYRALLAFSIWWNQTSARTVDQAKLSADFHGIILFSLDGGYQDIRSTSSGVLIRFTKSMKEDETFTFRIDVRSAPISDAKLEAFLTRVHGLAGGEISLCRAGDQDLAGEIRGPLANNYQALESVTRSLITALGFESNAKFKFRSGGPSDHQAVKEYFGLKGSSRDDSNERHR